MKHIYSIDEKIIEKVYEKFNTYFRMRYLTNKKSENYDIHLDMFHYIFNLGDDGKTYLWNEYIAYEYELSQFCQSDFNDDEINFLKSIEAAKQDTINKYGSLTKHHNINKPIESNRLILKAFNKETSKSYDDYFYANKEEFKKYYRDDYDNTIISFDMDKRSLGFAIFLKESNTQIGSICLTEEGKNVLADNDTVLYNVEYFITKEYRNKGYAYEALTSLINQIKTNNLFVLSETFRKCVYNVIHPDIRCLQIGTSTENIASQRIAEKSGFKKYGILLFSRSYDNKYYDDVIYYLVLNEDRTKYSNN